jgi:uncharacterized protein
MEIKPLLPMFTPAQKKNLAKLLSLAGKQEGILTLDGLHGFLFGLAITPVSNEPILSSEWLPGIIGEDLAQVEDEKEAERLLKSLFAAHNRINQQNHDGELSFPFEIGGIKPKDIQRIREWAYGLFLALSLRPAIWGMNEELDKEGKKQSKETSELASCTAVIMGVAFPEQIPELFQQSGKKAVHHEKPVELEAKMFALLPSAVSSIQEFGNAVRSGQKTLKSTKTGPAEPLRIVKVGRNDPCPCGSGSKYKKCCGK